jgi:MFS family permease
MAAITQLALRHRRLPDRAAGPALIVAVALAASDTSIVVLALPQLLARFHTSIGSIVWVIAAFALGAAVCGAALASLGRRSEPRLLLTAGLLVFACASVGCGAASTVWLLIALRALQGVGAALMLVGALPAIGVWSWARAGALGAALGPALGGALTQVFDWRAIFILQAPVALLALLGAAGLRIERVERMPPRPSGAVRENVALALVSGALVGALFLAVLLLVNGLGLAPIAAAGVVSAVPLAGLIAPKLPGGAGVRTGALLLASGLAGLAWVAHDSVALIGLALAICGMGLGLCGPRLSGQAGVTSVASRHAGLIIGLLLLSPLLAHGLSSNAQQAQRSAATQVLTAPVPITTKLPLAVDLFNTVGTGSGGHVPDLNGPFARARARGEGGPALDALQRGLTATERSAVAAAFADPFAVAALLALAALAALALPPARRRVPAFEGA